MQIPFTTTFSKIPSTYIPTGQIQEIVENFSYDDPSESVYKITGVRGSGKTVLLAKIEEEFSSSEREKDGWIVCSLTPTRDMLLQLAAVLSKKGYLKEKYNSYFDIGIELDEVLRELTHKKKKILIGIDEVSKNPDMMIFASEFGKWMRAGFPVYMVCTGLYENIEQLYNVKNLTFFRRATTIKTEPLNVVRMTEMYKQKLKVSPEEAKELAKKTMGYPYAFQELGVLYFNKKANEDMEDIESQLKSELFSYSYEKIWEEMSCEDRELVKLLTDKNEYKREEVIELMEKPANYSTYRDRLLRRGILVARRGFISLALPYFAEYVKEYGI